MQFPFGPNMGQVPFKLAEYDWTHNWKAAQLKRGVVPGPTVIPGKTHPDVGKTFEELDPVLKDKLVLLAMFRLLGFIRWGERVITMMIRVGQGSKKLHKGTRKVLAEQLHEQWLLWYRLQDGPPRAGYCHWRDEPEEHRLNDLLLMDFWCQTWAEIAKEDEPWKTLTLNLVLQKFAPGETSMS